MKRNYWPLFFIGLFSFVFSMIIWTIVNTQKVSITEDRSFQKEYQEVDMQFNDIMMSNKNFNNKYDLTVILNKKEFDLTVEDIRYSQRVLEKKSPHKNLLYLGKNDLAFYAIDKETQEKKKINVSLKVTKSNSDKSDFILDNTNFKNINNEYIGTFDIKEENNWNITGTFEVDGTLGYFYIKTNAL